MSTEINLIAGRVLATALCSLLGTLYCLPLHAAEPVTSASFSAQAVSAQSEGGESVTSAAETTSNTQPAPAPIPQVPVDETESADYGDEDPYAALTPYDTMIAISPTGKTLPKGVGRFNLDEIVLQQFNFGVSERLQLGVNISFILAASVDVKYRFTNTDSPWQIALLAGAGTQLIGADSDRSVLLFTRAAFSRFWPDGKLINATAGLYSGGIPGAAASENLLDTGLFRATGTGFPITFGFVLPIRDQWFWVNDAGVLLNMQIIDTDWIPAGWISALRYVADNHRYAVQFGWTSILMGANLRNYMLGVPYLGMNWLF